MIKVEAFIHPSKLEDAKAVLERLCIRGVIISVAFDHGDGRGQTLFYRGAEYHADALRSRLEMLVSPLQVDEVVEALSRAARTPGSADDGRILLYEVAGAIHIKSGNSMQPSLH